MPSRLKTSNPTVAACTDILSSYASKGFFTGFTVQKEASKQVSYQLHWHFNMLYQIDLNLTTQKIQMPVVLPNVKARSSMDKDFRAFIQERCSPDLPEHRRFDSGQLKAINRGGNLSLSMNLRKEESEKQSLSPQETAQMMGRFVGLLHEVFKVFLKNGHYDQYVSEQYKIDADSFW